MTFTEEENNLIIDFIENDDWYTFDIWDFNNNRVEGENIVEYLKRQQRTDKKILEFIKEFH